VGHTCYTQLLYFLVFLINSIRYLSFLKVSFKDFRGEKLLQGGGVMLFDEAVKEKIEDFYDREE